MAGDESDDPRQERPNRGLATRLIHPLAQASHEFVGLNSPLHRASTVVFPTLADVCDSDPVGRRYSYGLSGTPTTRELEARLETIEGAARVLLAPSGLAAISLTYLALCHAGSHVLVPQSAYGPNGRLAHGVMRRFGVTLERYDPMIGAGIAELIRDDTALIWCESPGSITMEVQDIFAICAAATDRDVPVAVDNTYAAGVLFNPLDHGAAVSVQALTKYQAGHGDVLMGSVAARDADVVRLLGEAHLQLGLGVSPDDCALVLRGLLSFPLRLKHIGEAALDIAHWLKARPEVEAVLHPALPDCPGHEYWRRDFTGSAGVFSFIARDWNWAQVEMFVNSLELFKIGFSWGGAVSLALAYDDLQRPTPEAGQRLIRLSIGLEDIADLKADLALAFAKSTA